MAFTLGTRIGSYEITSAIGEGGMGVVFRARDTKLGREVAVKVLPDAFAADRDRLARFEREAQVLASLNHPNIAHIYGLEEFRDTRCIVMELVEGETLSDRLRRGPVPLDEAIQVVKQLADALETAHERGIIHRDLKPANIKFTGEGAVKVLDFGLAKIHAHEGASVDASNSPTLGATGGGVILGTVAYMSPEQARGKTVDARADVWALGCVFYEMLTGRQAFWGETISDHIASVLKAEPDWDALPGKTPRRVVSIIRDCLEKNPKERLHSIADVRIQLKEAQADTFARVEYPVRTRRPIAAGIFAAMALLLALLLVLGRIRAPETAPLWVSIPPPPYGFGKQPEPAVSPDGKQVAFVAPNANAISVLWIRSMDSATARPLPNTEGATAPFWSSDGQNIGFFAQSKLKKIATAGGSPQTLADAPIPR